MRRCCARRQNQNRQTGTHAANGSDEAQAIAIGQPKVEHHGVVRYGFNVRGGIVEACGSVNAEPALFGGRTHIAPQGGIIPDNQNPHAELLISSPKAALTERV
jgi:hypothetical protein